MFIFWLDAKEIRAVVLETRADAKETKAIVKDIVEKMDARDCSYPLDLVVIPGRSSRTVTVEEVLQKLQKRLSPPNPSINYNIGLRDLHRETATWFLEGRILQEWYSTGSLLWIHGKRTFVKMWCFLVPDSPHYS